MGINLRDEYEPLGTELVPYCSRLTMRVCWGFRPGLSKGGRGNLRLPNLACKRAADEMPGGIDKLLFSFCSFVIDYVSSRYTWKYWLNNMIILSSIVYVILLCQLLPCWFTPMGWLPTFLWEPNGASFQVIVTLKNRFEIIKIITPRMRKRYLTVMDYQKIRPPRFSVRPIHGSLRLKRKRCYSWLMLLLAFFCCPAAVG